MAISACLVIAAFTVLLLTEPLRRLAIRTHFFDNPGAHKSHEIPVPYLGGVALVVGTLGGVAARWGEDRLAVIIGLGCVLAIIGLLDDRMALPAAPRFAAQGVVALVLVTSGTPLGFTGIELVDVAMTVVAVIALTNAWNFLDNMDGLASGLTAATGIALAIVGGVNGDLVAATIGAALAGAAIGFLAFNAPPAAIYLGDTGSLFAGFLVSATALEVAPGTPTGTAPLVALLLLGVPALDIAVVCFARLRRRIPLTTGGRNHLSHRLVALGLSRGQAVTLLVAFQLATAMVAVLLATTIIGPVVAALLGTGILAVLFAVTVRAVVFNEPIVRLHQARAGLGMAVMAVVVAMAPTVGAREIPWATLALETAVGSGEPSTTTVTGQGCGGGDNVVLEAGAHRATLGADDAGHFVAALRIPAGTQVTGSCGSYRFTASPADTAERPDWPLAALGTGAVALIAAAVTLHRRRRVREAAEHGTLGRRTRHRVLLPSMTGRAAHRSG